MGKICLFLILSLSHFIESKTNKNHQSAACDNFFNHQCHDNASQTNLFQQVSKENFELTKKLLATDRLIIGIALSKKCEELSGYGGITFTNDVNKVIGHLATVDKVQPIKVEGKPTMCYLEISLIGPNVFSAFESIQHIVSSLKRGKYEELSFMLNRYQPLINFLRNNNVFDMVRMSAVNKAKYFYYQCNKLEQKKQ